MVKIRGLIAGVVASTAIALTGNVAAQILQQDRVNNQNGGLSGDRTEVAAVDMKQAREALTARASAAGVMKKSASNAKTLAHLASMVEDLSDATVMSLSGLSTAEVETALFGSQASRDLLQSLIEKRTSVAGITKALGDINADLTYNPLQPCRILDTRNAIGPLTAFTNRNFDITTAAITAQGGVPAGGCGIPTTARAISVNITVIGAGAGYLFVWPDTFAQPNASILNFSPATGGPIANAAVVSIFPTNPAAHMQVEPAGTTGTHVIMDVLGYFAPPVATALQCQQVTSAMTAIPVNSWTNLLATCSAGYSVTGGGWFTNEGSLGWPGVWLLSIPSGSGAWLIAVDNQTNGPRNVQAWATCCRVPGR